MYGSFIYRYFFVNASPLDPPPEIRSSSMAQGHVAAIDSFLTTSSPPTKSDSQQFLTTQTNSINFRAEPNRYMYDSYMYMS